MSFVETKGKFHVGLDGVGLLLQGAPAAPAYRMTNAPVYGTRFASGDRDYNDLSQWWYLIQTDWSGGFKSDISFEDDAKFYYSTNIDARTKPGSIQLERALTAHRDNNVGGNDEVLHVMTVAWKATSVMTSENVYIANNKPKKLSDGTDFLTGTGDAEFLHSHRGYGWSLGTSVYYWSDPTSPTSQTSNINSVIAGSIDSAYNAVSVGDVLYIFGIADDDSLFCVKTSVANPSSSGDYTLVFQTAPFNNLGGSIVGAQLFGTKIIMLVEGSPLWGLYSLDIASGVVTRIHDFTDVTQIGVYSVGQKYLVPFQGKLLITTINDNNNGYGSIWELDTSLNLTLLYSIDEVKKTFTSKSESIPFLRGGCVVFGNYAYWGNLVYDGSHFFNHIKTVDDDATYRVVPLGHDGSNIYFADTETVSSDDQTYIYSYDHNGTSYKTGASNSAYLVFSNHDKLQSIDKLVHSITIGFNQFASGQSISIYYTTAQTPDTPNASWTSLGTASYALDGATPTSKMFLFPVGTTAKKIWFRVELVGGGSNTPELTDFTLEYLPMPDYKKQWALNINCADEVKRLDGTLVETTARELKSRLERAWWTKSALDFQDLDYASTYVNDSSFDATETIITVVSTVDFPEQGRIKVDDEEILYTGKTPTTFTGCTRGARGTRASTHANSSVVHNGYRVIITDVDVRVPILLEDKHLEYVVGISLREV